MKAWRVTAPGPDLAHALTRTDMPDPSPGPGELLVAVDACGVCRTDLHVTARELPVHRVSVVPGHEVVGHVAAVGDGVTGYAVGDRAGVAWLRSADCGRKVCRTGVEDLCPHSQYAGWDADGGYAEYTTVRAAFASRLPDGYSTQELAPL